MTSRPISKRNSDVFVTCTSCCCSIRIDNPLDRLFETFEITCPDCGLTHRVALNLKHGIIGYQIKPKGRGIFSRLGM